MRDGECEVLISIVVPVWEVSAYISRCLRSVMRQTYSHIECILVDDASQDDSIAQCEQLIAGYCGPIRFSILHHSQNRGLSEARNTGTYAAAGEFIYYLDSDDELLPDSIENLVRPVLRDASIEMVMGDYAYYVGPDTASAKTQGLQEADVTGRENVKKIGRKIMYVNAWNKLISRWFILNNRLRFKEGIIIEDRLWTFYVMQHLSHLYIVPNVTYLHYKRPNSIMTGTSEKELARNRAIVYEEIASYLLANGDPDNEIGYYAAQLALLILGNPESQAYRRSARLFKQALAEKHNYLILGCLATIDALSRSRIGQQFLHVARFCLRAIRKFGRVLKRGFSR